MLIPSGELTVCHGKSPFLMGKSTISMAIFHCYVSLPEGIPKGTRMIFPGGGVASQSLGATLSAAMCGGALELLLLGTACAEPLLRACAFEAEKMEYRCGSML